MVGKAKPTPNKIVCVRRREGGSGSGWLGRSPYGLAPTPASTHSFAALVLLRKPLSGLQNRHIQPDVICNLR